MTTEQIEKLLQKAEGSTAVILPKQDFTPVIFQGTIRRATEIGDGVWSCTGQGAAFGIQGLVTKYFEPSDLATIITTGQIAAPAGQLIQPAGNARVK